MHGEIQIIRGNVISIVFLIFPLEFIMPFIELNRSNSIGIITKKTAKTRIKNRKDHFMPDSLVDSQFAILEEPDVCITLEETLSPEEATSHLTSIIKNKFDYEK